MTNTSEIETSTSERMAGRLSDDNVHRLPPRTAAEEKAPPVVAEISDFGDGGTVAE